MSMVPAVVGVAVGVGLNTLTNLPITSQIIVAGASAGVAFGVQNMMGGQKAVTEEPSEPVLSKKARKKLAKQFKKKEVVVEEEEEEEEEQEVQQAEPVQELSKGQKRRMKAKLAKERREKERLAAEKAAAEAALAAVKAEQQAKRQAGKKQGKKEAAPLSRSQKKKLKKKQAAAAKKAAAEAIAAANAAAAAAAVAAASAPVEVAPVEEVQQPEEDLGGEWNDSSSSRDAKARTRYFEKQQAKIEAAAAKAAGPQEVVFDVPVEHHGAIFGLGSATLHAIQEATNTKISMPKRGLGSTAIVVEGLRPDLAKVKTAFDEIVANGFCALVEPNTSIMSTQVAKNKRGNVIGKGACNLRAIQNACDVKIDLPEQGSEDNTVSVRGEEANCQRAIAAIQKLASEGYCLITHPEWIKLEVDFPAFLRPRLFGAGGKRIRDIQDKHNCKISVPKAGDVSLALKLAGRMEDLIAVQTELNLIKREAAEEEEEEPVAAKEWGGEGDDLVAQFEW